MCYAAVSWYGKTDLFFIEGHAAGQETIPVYRRKTKTINQIVYRDEMCHLMFQCIQQQMAGQHWVWQQDGAKAHTALDTVSWLQQNTPEFIEPVASPAKSPDLNVMDFCIWSLLLS